MTYEEIFKQVKEMFATADVSMVNENVAFQFNITGEGEGAFYCAVIDGKISIEPYEYYDRDAIFWCDAELLINLAKGNVDPIIAYTTGKLRIDGSLEKAILLQSFLGKGDVGEGVNK